MLDLLGRLAFARENVDEGCDERRKDAVETSDRVRGDARGDSLVRAERSSSAVGLGWKLAIASSILLGIAALCVGVYAVFVGIAASASVSVAQQKQGGATRSWSMQNNSLTAGPTAGPESTLENQAIGPSQASRDYISPEVVETLKSAVQRSGIVIDPFGAPVVMFSDPLCPSCRKFEASIAAKNYKEFVPLIIPVAFKPGSMDVAVGILCSKDPVKAWKDVMAKKSGDIKPPAPPCEEGRKIMEQNNADFSKMGFDGTPTFVAINGRVLRGSLEPKDMVSWAKENTPSNVWDGQKYAKGQK